MCSAGIAVVRLIITAPDFTRVRSLQISQDDFGKGT